MRPATGGNNSPASSAANRRLNLWYAVIIASTVVFIGQLFYLQIVKHDYYRQQALAGQLKEYEITAQRGVIKAHENGSSVPLVLNQKLYTLYADPLFVKKPAEDALKLAAITSGDAPAYAKLMKTPKSRYVILAKRLSEEQKNKILALKLPGVGTQAQNYRTYPQGSLAAQLLGFVNDDGKGKYGLEQAMNDELSGQPGKLKAITDASGVPLAASRANTQIDPQDGRDIELTIDISMQKQLETILKAGLERARSASGSALIMNPNNGAILAMANYPTYDPAKYFDQRDASIFNNAAVSAPLEVGSTMKTFTASAALDLEVINPDTSYYDPGRWTLDEHDITNIEEVGGAATRTVTEILNRSVNTGATWILMQMGGETGKVNQKARERWHDYMVNHFRFGKPTGIEQGYEAEGYVPDPLKGYALQLTYANTAFGQAMTATPLQMAAALSAVINGGTYYQPRLVNAITDASGKIIIQKSKIVRQGVVATKVSSQIQSLLEYIVKGHFKQGASYLKFPEQYVVGGKTGTAQIANPAGGYFENKFNGTYIGFVGGAKPQYAIVVRVNEPHIGGYAGSRAAQPLFADLAHMLINNFNITPKS